MMCGNFAKLLGISESAGRDHGTSPFCVPEPRRPRTGKFFVKPFFRTEGAW